MEIKESKIIDLNEWENNKKTEQSGFSNNQTIREKILNEANNVVNIGREQTYGNPENNFKFIADMWSVYLGKSIYPSGINCSHVILSSVKGAVSFMLITTVPSSKFLFFLVFARM